jgi:hypothetical protein
MAITRELKTGWENDLGQSVIEKDVLKLRNQIKIIQRSPEFQRRDYRFNAQVRETNL